MAQKDTSELRRLCAAFHALSNTNRLQIYQLIVRHSEAHGRADLAKVDKGCAFGDFVKRLNIGAPTVSHHVKALVDAGLIHVEKVGRQRFCRPDVTMQKTLATFLTEK